MKTELGISEVKAKFAAMCDHAAQGEPVRFTRQRGSKVEHFELRQVSPAKRELGSWKNKLSVADVDALSAPLTDEELGNWNI